MESGQRPDGYGGNTAPYLSALDFYISPVWNIQFDELDF